ncbi:hypothetical protein CEXT_157901 [Caerostris extrusa]|uniref:Uncharacterized protein n=1 Tax=Caerostris extrusa TaxID=172846 RepID=A0AAV4XVR7_CAEEX|nr:hypothetical protein CEXT_157901 [Caerostris extrusa]
MERGGEKTGKEKRRRFINEESLIRKRNYQRTSLLSLGKLCPDFSHREEKRTTLKGKILLSLPPPVHSPCCNPKRTWCQIRIICDVDSVTESSCSIVV